MTQHVTIIGSLIQASDLVIGDTLLGLDNGYVIEVEEGNGYLSYPRTGPGLGTAMSEDTICVTYHDADGNENYVLSSPDSLFLVRR